MTPAGLEDRRLPRRFGSPASDSALKKIPLATSRRMSYGYVNTSLGAVDPSFTGQSPDTVSTDDDFVFREYSIQGRWPSPDPAALTAVDPSIPQSWNRYAYVDNSPCNSIDPAGLDTCTFDIGINNNAKLTSQQLGDLLARINAVLGSALWNGNSVQAQFFFTGKADQTLNISPSAPSNRDGYSGWPFSSPVIYWGNLNNNTTYGGTDAAHELVHRLAGPVLALWGKYKGPPNLMNVNQAQASGLGNQVSADWSNPSATAGFSSLSADQIKKLYKKCIKKHKGGGGGGVGEMAASVLPRAH